MIRSLRHRLRENAAAKWHVRMAQPSSGREVEAFEAWLTRNPENARVYAQLDDSWHLSGSLDPARTRRLAQAAPRRAPVLRPALAAGLLVLAIAALVVLTPGAAPPAYAAIVNDGVAVRAVKLADGTRIWLDVGARVGVRTIGGNREIAVREGRVRVLPGTGTTVTVTAHGAQVAPGAAPIDVTVAGSRVEVSALAAPVAVAATDDLSSATTVGTGQAVVLDGRSVRSGTADRTWPSGRVRFAATRLDAIVRLANRVGDPDLAVPDPAVAALEVSGVLDLRDTRRLARKLAATFDLRVDERQDALVLRR